MQNPGDRHLRRLQHIYTLARQWEITDGAAFAFPGMFTSAADCAMLADAVEALSAEERQESFHEMMEAALETARKRAE